MRWLVTGASRGIGRELVRQLEARGDAVVAVVRNPDSLAAAPGREVIACDVADGAAVAALAAAIGAGALDVVVNNAGVWPADGALGQLDHAEVARSFAVNAAAPLRVTEALLPALRRGHGKKVVHVSSGLASIADTSGGWYGYRMAKAALNMMAATMARDLARDGIVTAVLDPGWVQTDMGGPGAPTPVAASVRGLLAQIDALDRRRSGAFLHWQGGTTPW